MDNNHQEIDLLFEVSWEVCNKIGGIYTVLSSKSKTLKERYKDRFIFIGPDVWSEDNPSPYFIETPSLLKAWAKKAMLPEGVDVRVGRWDVPGKPVAVLVKFDGMYRSKDDAYTRMWNLYGVDSLHAYGDYDEGCAFGRAAAEVIESLIMYFKADPSHVAALFDEWTTAMGLLTLKADMPRVATIFTTHATSIGRSICGNGKPLYDQLHNYNGDQMADELNMQSKHSLEKAAALNADAFTTVSEVTADEAEQLLGRRPLVTPNGFEPDFVPGRKAYAQAREAARKRIFEVASTLNGTEYTDDTFIVATSGRCEYRNKGIDVYLDAVRRVADLHPSRRILALVLVPAWEAGVRPELPLRMAESNHRGLTDPVITHNLHNPDSDPIFNRIRQLGFGAGVQSGVSVIYVPCYLNGTDGVFQHTYYELLPGLDLTVFASYYEPWGYTPHESVAFGVPTVTTTLAGFGRWVLSAEPHPTFANCGVEVVSRTDHNYGETVEAIARKILDASALDAASAKKARAAAQATASRATWTDFIKYYYEAFDAAAQAAAEAAVGK